MITEKEKGDRERFYYHSFKHLTHIYGKPPTHTEMIMYVALILKENPIELSIALLKIDQQGEQNERANDIVYDFGTMAGIQDQIQAGD